MSQLVNKVERLSFSRRGFLKASGFTAGGLVLGTLLTGCSDTKPIPYANDLQLNAFIQITAQGDVLFFSPNAEMGQGALTGLTTLIAEELHLHPSKIETRVAGAHSSYTMPEFGVQITGGSTTMAQRFLPMRQMAASARELLLQAASTQLNVPKSSLMLQDGQIIEGNKSHDLAQFIDRARAMPMPKDVPLTPAAEFQWIGKHNTPRIDALAKVTGTAQFGIDVSIPEAKVAMVKNAPVIGSKPLKFTADNTKAMPGVRHIAMVNNGVAVVADTYWQASQAVETLQVEWDRTPLTNYSTNNIDNALQDGLINGSKMKGFESGEGVDALGASAHVYTALYKAPYLAHATMEPMNCTVSIQNNKMAIWIPTQAPDIAAQIAAEHSGISRDNITVHSTFLGGGFGRRVCHDYLAQAVEIALATGEVIKLVWSREDDMRNDYYRPVSWVQYRAGLDSARRLVCLSATRVGPNILPYVLDETLGAMLPESLPKGMVDWISQRPKDVFENWVVDPSNIEGLHEDYQVFNKSVEHVNVDPGLRLGFWRSVGHSYSGFCIESVMDELAHLIGADPLDFRIRYLGDNPRLQHVLKQAAELAGWRNAKQGLTDNGRYLGLAAHKSFNSYVAQVAEVSVVDDQIRVHKVVCVVDCGIAVNPDMVKAQMEGGINFGLSAALHQKITLQNGVVQQSNFHDFPSLRMDEAPQIEVLIVPSDAPPSGVGEPGTPPIAAAVANAVFVATGKRLRELPLRLT